MPLPSVEIDLIEQLLFVFFRWLARRIRPHLIPPAQPLPFTVTIERIPLMATYRAKALLITPDRPGPLPADVASQSIIGTVNGVAGTPQDVPLGATDFVFVTGLNSGDAVMATLAYANTAGQVSIVQTGSATVPTPIVPPAQPAPFGITFEQE